MINKALYKKNFYLEIQKRLEMYSVSPNLWSDAFTLFQKGLKEEMYDVLDLKLLIDFAISLINAKILTQSDDIYNEIKEQKNKLLKFVTTINNEEKRKELGNNKSGIISFYESIMDNNKKSK